MSNFLRLHDTIVSIDNIDKIFLQGCDLCLKTKSETKYTPIYTYKSTEDARKNLDVIMNNLDVITSRKR